MTNTNQTDTALDTTHVLECKDGTRIETTWHDSASAANAACKTARKRGADSTRTFAQPTSSLGRFRAVAFWTIQWIAA